MNSSSKCVAPDGLVLLYCRAGSSATARITRVEALSLRYLLAHTFITRAPISICYSGIAEISDIHFTSPHFAYYIDDRLRPPFSLNLLLVCQITQTSVREHLNDKKVSLDNT
jgi:hypothetical protein